MNQTRTLTGTVMAKASGKASIRYKPLYSPDLLKFEVSQTESSVQTVNEGRIEISDIVNQRSDRLLVVVGPSSLQTAESALAYARLLCQATMRFGSELCIAMRCNVEKPQMVNGWKGFLNDPFLDGSFEINQGLRMVRQLFVEITDMGLPIATELLSTLSLLYLTELVSVSVIGPQTADSSVHRELASSVQCPVGFVHRSGSDPHIAMDAIKAASMEHHYLSVTPEGRASIAWTPGNDDCFVILQGLQLGQDSSGICNAHIIQQLQKEQKPPIVVADCSKDGLETGSQLESVRGVCKQLAAGEHRIVGIILESYIQEDQNVQSDKAGNGSMGWDATMLALQEIAEAVRQRRSKDYPMA